MNKPSHSLAATDIEGTKQMVHSQPNTAFIAQPKIKRFQFTHIFNQFCHLSTCIVSYDTALCSSQTNC